MLFPQPRKQSHRVLFDHKPPRVPWLSPPVSDVPGSGVRHFKPDFHHPERRRPRSANTPVRSCLSSAKNGSVRVAKAPETSIVTVTYTDSHATLNATPVVDYPPKSSDLTIIFLSWWKTGQHRLTF